MRLTRYGDRALFLQTTPAERTGLYRAIRELGLADVVDIVAGESSVVVICESPSRVEVEIAQRLPVVTTDYATRTAERTIEIPVHYDGEDLAEVAEITGMSAEEVIGVHLSAEYAAAFCGFAPGFTYLTGLPERLQVARRSTPRPRVPAGSVAVAAGYTAVYPRATPGGWRLLGTTDAVMFDVERENPALITPGDRVRFLRV